MILATINKDILVLKPVGVTGPWGKYMGLEEDPTANAYFTKPTTLVVISSSIPSCKTDVPFDAGSLTITFSEPVILSVGAVELIQVQVLSSRQGVLQLNLG